MKIFSTLTLIFCFVAVNLLSNPQNEKIQLDSIAQKNIVFQTEGSSVMSMAFLYNNNQLLTQMTHSNYIEPEDNGYTVYQYNDNNSIKSEIIYSQNNQIIGETEYLYNSNNQITIINESFEDYYYKYEYSYKENQLFEVLFYYIQNDKLIPLSAKNYKYDGNKIIEITNSYVDDENINKRTIYDHNYYTYNDKNQLILIETFSGEENDEENDFIITKKQEFVYDEFDNLKTISTYEYDTFKEKLVLEEKETYSYDNEYSLSDLVLPLIAFKGMEITSAIMFNHKLDDISFLNYETDYTDSSLIKFNYSSFKPSSINESIASASIFPNPVADYIKFNWDNAHNIMNLQIYDINGNLIMTKKITNGESIPLAIINKGNYVYNLFAGKTILKGNFIKE